MYNSIPPLFILRASHRISTFPMPKPKDPAKGPSPQELRKIEKDRRRKQYEDIQVQGTNNSSIVSKRSVEMIYKKVSPEGEFFKYFVPKGKRRSPAINRGYWIRMESIRRMIFRIAEKSQQSINIINLGCGFDPLPFQILNMQYRDDITFYDIDYPDLVKNKHDMTLKLAQIMDLLGEDNGERDGYTMNYNRYKLIGCDLKDYTRYEQVLKTLQPDSVNIFIAEVSLAYMHYEDANKIIEYSSKASNAHFLILEQILPTTIYESFSKRMLAHFKKLRSSLKCVEQYPLKQDQVNRFKNYFKEVEIKDLFENWNDLIEPDTKTLVEEAENFDEWEEFILFCQHYVIVHATNTANLVYKVPNKQVGTHPVAAIDLVEDDSPRLNLKFAASCGIHDDVYTFGGLEQTRSGDLYKNGTKVEVANGPSARMCHTMTTVGGDCALVIGGRTRPGVSLSDVYRYDQAEWHRLKDLPYGVHRHETVVLNEQEVLILGGQEQGDQVMVYNHHTETCRFLKYNGAINLAQIKSFGCTYRDGVGYIVGGMMDKEAPKFSDKLIRFRVFDHELECGIADQGPGFERVDCRLVQADNTLIVVGGVNYNEILGQTSLIVQYDLNNKVIYDCKIPDSTWKSQPPMFIGHNVVQLSGRFHILHGGAVCYSFGSAYSGNYVLTPLTSSI